MRGMSLCGCMCEQESGSESSLCMCVCVCVCIGVCERGGEIPTLHRQTTGDGAHSRPNSQAAQETQQRPVPPAFLHGESCVDKRPAAKQRCGLEDSSHRDTRTTTAQKSRDGHVPQPPPAPTAPTMTNNHPLLSSSTEEKKSYWGMCTASRPLHP